MFLSVIICTHNPRMDYLERVLEALRSQSLTTTSWELLLIDNASDDALSERIDLSWHPAARCIREDELGLTAARLRGIAEARGDLLVFVDDDNVLAPDYLQIAGDIAEQYPVLGSWGSGRVEPDFEIEPPPELIPHLPRLALRNYHSAHWSNNPDHWSATPVGAGLCVTRDVACDWAQRVRTGDLTTFCRTGDTLLGGEDITLALGARRFGLGWGTFPEMRLTHLIPRRRITKSYLLRLTEGSALSTVAIAEASGRRPPTALSASRFAITAVKWLARGKFTQLAFLRARQRGFRRGHRLKTGGVV
jgi:glycosyltransferase involved in cell wall biosynthesis